jgi:hypothetical protein
MFDNWPAGVDKKERAQIRVGACAFLWALWNVCMIIFLTEQNKKKLCRLSHRPRLDPYVVLPTTNEQATGNGFWVQPAEVGRTRFIQPVQLAF